MADASLRDDPVVRTDDASAALIGGTRVDQKSTALRQDRAMTRASGRAGYPGVREETDGQETLLRERRKPWKLPETEQYRRFRLICDPLVEEVKRLDEFLVDDEIADEGLQAVVEIEELLEKLYDCPWGEGTCLKRVVVAVQAQINNIRWMAQHVRFLQDFIPFLRVRYLIDEATVTACYDAIKAHGLDRFRGSVSETAVLKRYRIEEIKEK